MYTLYHAIRVDAIHKRIVLIILSNSSLNDLIDLIVSGEYSFSGE